ncbi:MAG: type II toxin-antitoxin system HicA family toxin [Dehalococcoidia bacterium]|nr:type II toxin-antitoxin system HicA family toxin [Dehalococcoidia bacterium]
METQTRRIRRRLVREGWYLERHGRGHDIYRHPDIPHTIILPRHRTVSSGVARRIAKDAGWEES